VGETFYMRIIVRNWGGQATSDELEGLETIMSLPVFPDAPEPPLPEGRQGLITDRIFESPVLGIKCRGWLAKYGDASISAFMLEHIPGNGGGLTRVVKCTDIRPRDHLAVACDATVHEYVREGIPCEIDYDSLANLVEDCNMLVPLYEEDNLPLNLNSPGAVSDEADIANAIFEGVEPGTDDYAVAVGDVLAYRMDTLFQILDDTRNNPEQAHRVIVINFTTGALQGFHLSAVTHDSASWTNVIFDKSTATPEGNNLRSSNDSVQRKTLVQGPWKGERVVMPQYV
ncbi:hypothetical protein EV182_002293, partial [Spiromyces aspiralis]